MQIAKGFPDPGISHMPKLEGVIKAKSLTPRSRPRLPITPNVLLAMGAVWEAGGCSQDHIMLWSAVTLCFFGFLRSGELTVASDASFDPAMHFTFQDITVDDPSNPSLLKLRLKASKTDPFRKGVDIVVGVTKNKLCPVTAMLAYLALRGNGPGFLFRFQDGKLLTKSRFVDAVRAALFTAGLCPKDYAGHSFRIGAATTANACGLNEPTIQMLGRWTSSAYSVYIRTPRDHLASLSLVLGSSTP